MARGDHQVTPLAADIEARTIGALTNTPEHTGVDPHGDPRYTVAARQQKAAFLSPDGKVIDVCGGGPCQAERDPARP